MNDERDNLEILKEFVNKQEIETDVLSDAKAIANEKYGDREKKINFWKSHAIAIRSTTVSITCLLLLVALIIVTLIMPARDDEYTPRFFSEAELTYNDITSVSEFCQDKTLDLCYFEIESIQENSRVYFVEETNQFAILYQNIVCFGIVAVDEIELNVCVMDDEFERFDEYLQITDTIDYNEITVYKSISSKNGQFTTLARFELDGNYYYLKIISFFEDPLTYYLDLLIS